MPITTVARDGDTDSEAMRAVYVATLFDTSNLKWAPEIFNFAVDLINDHEDGWFDDILDDGTYLETTISNSGCDPHVALPAYWKLRTEWGDPLHGVVGCRCSGASATVARVAGLESVPIVSPTSSDSDLSDADRGFNSFSRLVGPDDERGQVGALVRLLRSMGWDRVSVLATDKTYTLSLATAFGSAWVGDHSAEEVKGGGGANGTATAATTEAWVGEVAFSHTIALGNDGKIDEESVRRALRSVPVDNPHRNSRVILLLAHHEHAYPILKIAGEEGFQKDTIWIGTDGWTDVPPPDGGSSWMPDIPGYLGLVPFRNQDDRYKGFLRRLQVFQRANNRTVTPHLPDYRAEVLVDSLLALVMALSNVAPRDRSDGRAVLTALRELSFAGLSGSVAFTTEGDRANPRYSVMNWQNRREAKWTEVGTIGTSLDSSQVRLEDICWAVRGCGIPIAPSDKPPIPQTSVPTSKLPSWVWVIISILAASVVAGIYLYFRLRRSRQMIREYFEEHMEVAEAKRNIENEIEQREEDIEGLKKRLSYLIQQPLDPQDKPKTWSIDTPNILVEISPEGDTCDEYRTVSDSLCESMPDAHITKLYRVQNHPLWIYFNFHRRRLRNSGVPDDNYRSVWHGTKGNDPARICMDIQDGFLMQHAHEGLWGRGVYFAEKSCYSDDYSFRPAAAVAKGNCTPAGSHEHSERQQLLVVNKRCANVKDDEREIILVRLLVGKETFIERPRPDLKVPPPIDPASTQRYNTVWSYTKGQNGITTKVSVVYENGRAYPDYLVRYYRGERGDSDG
mmetsp:Transcript_8028/g.23887  ORF Transcript_8028/g.23887 Transcript_8028/m.23887 type:complete len:792 (-) Transcript_8028:344-2719(-)